MPFRHRFQPQRFGLPLPSYHILDKLVIEGTTEEIKNYQDNKKEMKKREEARKRRQLAAIEIYRDITRNAATQTSDGENDGSQSNGQENQATQTPPLLLDEENMPKSHNGKDTETSPIPKRMTEYPGESINGKKIVTTDEDCITDNEVGRSTEQKPHSDENNTSVDNINQILLGDNEPKSHNQVLVNFYGEQSQFIAH